MILESSDRHVLSYGLFYYITRSFLVRSKVAEGKDIVYGIPRRLV